MLTISNKLKDQCVIWQKRLSELDISSKNQLSKEREHRRCSIQQQLDKSSSTENQLLEIIEGLEIMIDELVDEAKQAKKERRVAIKLYEKSKDVASAHLEKLLTEKEAKKHLKDELASLLKIQQSQQILLDNYKTMIEGFKSSKLSLKQEVKVGWRGGARWPLWVTEVCCELQNPIQHRNIDCNFLRRGAQEVTLDQLCPPMSSPCSSHWRDDHRNEVS